jgi:hypothetical protein
MVSCLFVILYSNGHLFVKDRQLVDVCRSAVLLSQFLIILYWSEAKFGTLANIIILAGITLFYAHWRFHHYDWP